MIHIITVQNDKRTIITIKILKPSQQRTLNLPVCFFTLMESIQDHNVGNIPLKRKMQTSFTFADKKKQLSLIYIAVKWREKLTSLFRILFLIIRNSFENNIFFFLIF